MPDQREFKRQLHDVRQNKYIAKPEKGTISEIPGSKTIEYLEDGWRVLDTYVVSPVSPFSGGTTIIYYRDLPVWMMQYNGYYHDDAIPCLKAALAANYEQKVYNGGRGPESFEHEGFHYFNAPMSNEFFGRTSGQETIFNSQRKLRGVHLYQAWWMIDYVPWMLM
jgi:hypothetical protein